MGVSFAFLKYLKICIHYISLFSIVNIKKLNILNFVILLKNQGGVLYVLAELYTTVQFGGRETECCSKEMRSEIVWNGYGMG